MITSVFKYLGIVTYVIAYGLMVANQLYWGHWSSSMLVGLIFLASIILWTNVSIEWPSLITLILIGMLPEIGFNKLGEISFGNQTFVFLVFTFAATQVLVQTGALGKLTQKMMQLSWIGQSAKHYMLGFLLLTLALACIFSPSVLFMFLFPMYQSICEQCHLKKGDPIASKYLVAFISTIAIGTAMTPINHIFALTAMSLFQEATGETVTYLTYMALGVPAGLLTFAIIFVSVSRLVSQVSFDKNTELSTQDLIYSSREKVSLVLYGLMILLWLLPEFLLFIGLDIKVFLGNGAMVFPPLIISTLMLLTRVDGEPIGNISEMFNKGLHWPSLLLLSATLALGSVMSNPDVGFIQTIQAYIPETMTSLPIWMIASIFVFWSGLQTNVSSNLVTVSLVTTFLLTTMTSLSHSHLQMIAMMIGFMASVAVMTPPAMPYVAIAIGSQWTDSRACIKFGGLVIICAMISVLVISFILIQIRTF